LLLVSQVIYGKIKKMGTIILICFLCLTLPICARIGCQDIKQERKIKNLCKSQLPTARGNMEHQFHTPQACHNEFMASQLATASQRRENGEEPQRIKVRGNQISPWPIASPGELRRPNLLKVDVAETHWKSNVNSPWQAYLAWRVYKFLQKYKSLSSHFEIILSLA